jgi:DNA-directed RNA polymerase specialized sigma24 family protein
MPCFGLLRKGILMAEVDSQRQQDELLANIKLVDPAATDEVLVAAAKLGNHPAFLQLWMRHSDRVFKVAYRITRNREDAEDASQEAWMKAYLRLNTFEGRAQFSNWLTRIAINSSLMILRKNVLTLRLLWRSRMVTVANIGRLRIRRRMLKSFMQLTKNYNA